jgi:hypothetical protein
MKRHRQKGSRKATAWLAVALVLLLLGTGSMGIWLLVAKPIQKVEAGVVPIVATPSATPTPSAPFPPVVPDPTPTPSQPPARECKAGMPAGFTWDDLGISNAPIEKVGANDQNVLQPPNSKHTIGVFYEPQKGRGHLPGQGLGNIIMEGHTYADDSSVFRHNADDFIHEGSVFWFTMDNGSVCKYQVSKVFHQLKDDPPAMPGHEMFADVSQREGFYDLTRTSEQLVGMTCAGEFNADHTHHLFQTVWFAQPIN